MRPIKILGVAFALGWLTTSAFADSDNSDLVWRPWNKDQFVQAKAENRFVILDLEAVWCHWCHVMEQTTYSDPKVTSLLKSKFFAVRVDQDANPDLSNRYGDWGWPATIIFTRDGHEIVKRAGYIPPDEMVSLIEAVVADPSPGPSVVLDQPVEPSKSHLLSPQRRIDLAGRSESDFDQKYAGWGKIHKFIDADAMDWELFLSGKGDQAAVKRAQRTLTAALNLIDPVEGGIFQYSDQIDWKSPHYEKIMWYQANGLRQYSQAYARWRDPSFEDAARKLKTYLLSALHSPEGAFFTSQDADVNEKMPGKAYYTLSRAQRDALPAKPRIDQHIYARENGWAIRALAAYHAATGDQEALAAAVTAAEWIIQNRRVEGGGFRHGESDRGGPFLGDTLAMGQAALDLYAATGHRQWLKVASDAGDFIASKFQNKMGGFFTAAQAESDAGVFSQPAKDIDEQVQVAKFANILYRYTGSKAYLELAEHGARYVNADGIIDAPRPFPGTLLLDAELSQDPTHITVVGHMDDPKAVNLHAAALAYPDIYRRIDWWDKRDGALPNPDIQYPELPEPAAFACTERICSLPVFEASELASTVQKMVQRTARTAH